MIIRKIFFFFSFSLISHLIAIRQPPLMIYWLTFSTTDNLLKLFHSTTFWKKDKFSEMKRLEDIQLDRIICYFLQNGEIIHTMSFNYVQIENFNPFSIKILNDSTSRHYILVSFNVQKENKSKNITNETNLCNHLQKPSLFDCNITNQFNKNEIFFFDNQCYISNQTNCMRDLAKYSLWNEQTKVIKYLNKNFQEKKKSCAFQNLTIIHRSTKYTSTTG